MRSCKGMTSSSQAITTTARNSSPLARCMVLIDTWPLAVSNLSSSTLRRSPAPSDRGASPAQFGRRTDEDADLVRHDAFGCSIR